jgi:helicase-like protein
MKRLDRIVIDECHVVLNEQRDFRPMLQQLGRLMTARTQMVLLTATLPPSLEDRLWQRMRWSREQVSVFRGRTSRTNVAYRIWRPMVERGFEGPHRWIQMDHVASFIRDRIRRSRAGRTIVYAPVVAHVTTMAEILGCEAYYHDQLDKAGVLDRFRSQARGVIVATSALGMGVDIPDIRSIIHLGRPRTLLDYAQESGRAGRDGQASEAIIIQPEGMDAPPPWMQETPSGEQQRVDAYMSDGRCRRVILDGYLDGVVDGYQRRHCGDHHDGFIVGELPCDGCEPDWEAMESEAVSEGVSESASEGASITQIDMVRNRRDHHVGRIRDESRAVRVIQDGGLVNTGMIDEHTGGDDMRYTGRARSIDSESLQSQAPRASSVDSENLQSRVRPIDDGSAGLARPAASVHAAPAIPFSVRQQFQQQEIDRARMSEQQRRERQQEGMDEEFLMQQAREWQGRCWICTQEGRESEHELYYCMADSSQRARSWMMTVRRKVRYAAYTSCFQCGMPPTLCSGWKGGGCAHRGLLFPMVGMMLFGGPEPARVQRLWGQRLAERGFDAQDEKQVTEFLGQRCDEGGEKHTELVSAFIWLRRIYRSIGR